MRTWLLTTALSAALIILAPQRAHSTSAPTPNPTTPPAGISIDLGKADFRSYCAACHGVGGNGDGTVAEFLTIAAPDLTQLKKRNAGIFPRERIAEVIDGRAEVKVHGMRDMPVWGDWFNYEAMTPDTDRDARAIIVRERIESLIGYIGSIQMN